MDNKLLQDISNKLNVLISLQLARENDARLFDKGGERVHGVGAMARYLSDMGLNTDDISHVLGAPLTSIRTLLTPNRRK